MHFNIIPFDFFRTPEIQYPVFRDKYGNQTYQNLFSLNGLVTNQLPCGAVQFKRMYTLLISPGYLLGLKILFLWRKKKLSLQGKESVTCLLLCILCKKSYHIMSHGGEGEVERERVAVMQKHEGKVAFFCLWKIKFKTLIQGFIFSTTALSK